jgi:Family of unknown function (DUF5713)
MTITNQQILSHKFLQDMYEDDYFPNNLVDKAKQILIALCEAIEAKKPKNNESLLQLTHTTTNEFNELAAEFEEDDSELETVAREAIGADFEFIVKAYGFEVDIEDVIATRDW